MISVDGKNSGKQSTGFDVAWGQVRLVAPEHLAEHARSIGHAFLEFEGDAGNLSVEQAKALRENSPFLGWDQAKAFLVSARKDLKVESKITGNWRGR